VDLLEERISVSQYQTPSEKKALSYARDHVVAGGQIHDKFSRRWARMKARTNRRVRHHVRQRLHVTSGLHVHFLVGYASPQVHCGQIWKWASRPCRHGYRIGSAGEHASPPAAF
jgi:hypothetical protein